MPKSWPSGIRGWSASLCPLCRWVRIRAAGGGRGEGEQAGLRFGQHAAGDEAFEFGAQAFGVVGGGADAERVADVLGAEPAFSVGEHGEDLLVGGAGQGRVRWWRVVDGAGQP